MLGSGRPVVSDVHQCVASDQMLFDQFLLNTYPFGRPMDRPQLGQSGLEQFNRITIVAL